MRFVLIFLFILVGCNTEEKEVSKVPTGKGKIYGQLNERETPCKLKNVEKSDLLEKGWVCVYDHPKSKFDDRVSICYECTCPQIVYCDIR